MKTEKTEFDFPETIGEKYACLIGVLQAGIELELIDKEALILEGIKHVLTFNPHSNEQNLLNLIREYQVKPPVFPFGNDVPLMQIAPTVKEEKQPTPTPSAVINLSGEDVDLLNEVLTYYAGCKREELEDYDWFQIERIGNQIKPTVTAA